MLQSSCVCWLKPLKKKACKLVSGLKYILLGKVLVAVIFGNGFWATDPSICSLYYFVVWLRSSHGCWKAISQNCSETDVLLVGRGELAAVTPGPFSQGWMSLDHWVRSVLWAAAALLADYWYPVYFKGEAHPCKRMGTLMGQTCGTRNHYKSNCIFGWRLPSLTLPFSQNTPHCCTCIFPQGRKGNGEERHLVDITLLVQFPNSERWYPADECNIKTE